MAVKFPSLGHKVVARIIEMDNPCTIGMQPGDEFELSTHRCGDFCGLFYSSISGWVTTLQCSGTLPIGEDPDVQTWECPNPNNRVKVELHRIRT